jgi:predicted dehydrogenase
VVVVGDVECALPRRLFYEKELQVKFSRAYGPGRYDDHYEREGHDYPIAYVRWTMQRNMGEILRLMEEGQLTVDGLVTHRFPIADADAALRPLFEGVGARALGIIIDYPGFAPDHEGPVPLQPVPATPKAAADGVRIGLIGAGRFAQGILIPAFRTAGLDVFTRIVTNRGLSAVSAGRKFGVGEAVSRVEEVLAHEETNALLISTNHGEHASLICAGLERGKHVFCEKPLCLNEAELQRIEQAERASAAILMVGFNRRFSPFVTALREYMAFSSEPAAVLYRVNAGAQPPEHWVHHEEDGGGRIIGEACHYLDVAQFLIGSAPVRVHATALRGACPGRTYYDTVSLVVSYADGSTATIVFVANGDTGFPKEYLEMHRADSTAILENYRVLRGKGPQGRLRKRSFSQQKGFVEEARAFRAGCLSGQAPIAMAEMATVTRLTFAAMESLATGEPVWLAGVDE